MKYTIILFDVKKELNLSLREYIFLDCVFHLQTKIGFSYAKNDYYAELLDIGVREVQKIKSKMTEEGFLIVEKGYKTTEKWNNSYLNQHDQKVTPTTTKKSHKHDQKVTPSIIYKDKIENDTKNNTNPADLAVSSSKKIKIPLPWEKEDKIIWRDKLISQGLHGQILMEYFILKQMKFITGESANEALKRSIKKAREIAECYPDLKLIQKTMKYLKENNKPDFWTLETVLNKLPTIS